MLSTELALIFHLYFSSMNYNIDVVIETLNITLKQALNYHPQQVQWLRVEGDLEFRKIFTSLECDFYMDHSDFVSSYFKQAMKTMKLQWPRM